MSKYLRILAIPIAIVVANFMLFCIYFPEFLAGTLGEIIFNLARIIAVIYAGWLIAERYSVSIAAAAYSGIVVLFVAHVVLKGGAFLIQPLWDPEMPIHDAFKAFLGVLVSFFIFAPIAMVIAATGGWAARKFRVQGAPSE